MFGGEVARTWLQGVCKGSLVSGREAMRGRRRLGSHGSVCDLQSLACYQNRHENDRQRTLTTIITGSIIITYLLSAIDKHFHDEGHEKAVASPGESAMECRSAPDEGARQRQDRLEKDTRSTRSTRSTRVPDKLP